MAECDKYRVQFSSYLDGELPIGARKELEAHLAICEECAETIYQIRVIQQSLQRISPVNTSPGFENRLHNALREGAGHSSLLPGNLQGWKVPAMGSALLLASLGVFMVFNHGGDANRVPNGQYSPAAAQLPGAIQTRIQGQSGNAQANAQKEMMIADSLNKDSISINKNGIRFIGDH